MYAALRADKNQGSGATFRPAKTNYSNSTGSVKKSEPGKSIFYFRQFFVESSRNFSESFKRFSDKGPMSGVSKSQNDSRSITRCQTTKATEISKKFVSFLISNLRKKFCSWRMGAPGRNSWRNSGRYASLFQSPHDRRRSDASRRALQFSEWIFGFSV